MAGVILYPYMTSNIQDAIKGNKTEDNSLSNSFFELLNAMEETVDSRPEFEEENVSSPQDNVCTKRLLVH